MRRLAVALLAAALAGPLATSQRPAAGTHEMTVNGHTFTLPRGFTIELAAKPPLVDRPIVADLDDEGRLYVADSSGSNEKVAEQLKKKPHRILRLEDADGDGVYDKRSIFADRFMFPEGVMCLDGEVYVAAPPSIWKLGDADKDGVARKRVEWFAGKTLNGCANDLHGPYAGPDGWVYWCKGAFELQRYPRPGKKDLVTRAAHIFRARPDGTGIEPVMTGGMDNPVDVAFMPSGERVFTTTFFQHPGGGLRDGLIHAVYGGVYGKDHHVIHGHPRTGPDLMPVLAHMGPAAPAGLHRYESSAFGGDYRDNLFAAQFNMAKVSRHVLKPHGSTYKTLDEDFVVSSNRDFHPTDVIEDADGSLLVIDTGGWYKLCCPTSQLVKPDLLGAIYRVRRKDAPKVSDPRGHKVAWAKAGAEELAELLGDGRSVVRRRAVRALAAKGADALPSLKKVIEGGKEVEARRNAVWAATRIDHKEARAAVRAALADSDESVRQAALHSVSLWRDRHAMKACVKMLESRSAHNRRAAAEALGRMGGAKAVPALLEAAGRGGDRVLTHSVLYALIEIGDRDATRKGLESKSAPVRRAALVALNGMEGKLESAAVLKELTSTDPALKEAAWWIAGGHPEWGGSFAGHFGKRLGGVKESADRERAELAEQLSRFASAPAIEELVAARLAKGGADERRVLLQALAQTRLKAMPVTWEDPLLGVLSTAQKDLLGEAIRAARALPLSEKNSPKVLARLRDLASHHKLPAETRVAALAAIPGSLGKLDAGLFAFLSEHVDADRPAGERGPAASALARARLSTEQLLALAEAMKTVGPMELDALLELFAKGKDAAVGLKLLASLEASPVRSALHPDRLRARLASYPGAVTKKAEALIAALDADREKRLKQIDGLLDGAKKGDVRRGQLVFNSQKAACSSCHAIGYLGGKVGPDLTKVGSVRDERDLLESILFPSASFVRSYEPVQVTTKKGKVYNGVVRRESAEEIVLATNATEEVRIARRDIEEAVPSKVSIMPAGLDKALTAQELSDLVAFLKACK